MNTKSQTPQKMEPLSKMRLKKKSSYPFCFYHAFFPHLTFHFAVHIKLSVSLFGLLRLTLVVEGVSDCMLDNCQVSSIIFILHIFLTPHFGFPEAVNCNQQKSASSVL